jgi:hypothetical protein
MYISWPLDYFTYLSVERQPSFLDEKKSLVSVGPPRVPEMEIFSRTSSPGALYQYRTSVR